MKAKKKVKSKGPSAPSTMFGEKSTRTKSSNNKKEKTAGEKRLDKIVEKMKAKKKQPPISMKKSKKQLELEKTIEENRKQQQAWINAPCFGDDIIIPDQHGYDGHSSISTYAGLDRKLRQRLNSDPLTKDVEIIEKLTCANVWQWANWCDRLWFETHNSEIPTKRLVVIPFEYVIPHDDVDWFLSDLRNNGDFKQAMAALGHKRYKVRLIPKIEGEISVKSLNWINDLMSVATGIKTIQGIYLPNMDIEDIPRDVAFGVIPHQRKLSSVERFIDDLIDTKKRAVIQYETIRLLGSKISEIKQTAIYKKFKQSWGLQNPLIEVTTAMSESKIRKLSQLGDIIVNSTGE